MAEIPMVNGGVCVVDQEDVHLVCEYKWRVQKTGDLRYASTNIGGQLIFMHRLLMNVSNTSMTVDHIDGNGLNNSRSNMRICSHAENMANRRVSKNNKLGIKNVRLANTEYGPRFIVEVEGRGQRRIRKFKELQDAILCARILRAEVHGEFAVDDARAFSSVELCGHALQRIRVPAIRHSQRLPTFRSASE